MPHHATTAPTSYEVVEIVPAYAELRPETIMAQAPLINTALCAERLDTNAENFNKGGRYNVYPHFAF